MRQNHSLSSIIASCSSRLRDDVTALENVYNALVLEHNNLLEEKSKLEKLLEACHKQLDQFSINSSRQTEINNRLENIIMSFAAYLPQEEQIKLSNAVYAAKQFDQAAHQQFDIWGDIASRGDFLKSKDQLGSEDLIDSKASVQSSIKAIQQQAVVNNMIQLLQALASQTNSNGTSCSAGPKAERKKPAIRRRTVAAKKTSKITATGTQENPSTGANSEKIPAKEAPDPQTSASQALKQTSMFDYFGKTE